MTRDFAIVLVFFVICSALFAGWAGSNRKQYFDPALYKASYPCSLDGIGQWSPMPLDREVENWFSAPLRAINEPSLYLEKSPKTTTTIRFTYLPSFAEPVVVRIDNLYGEHPHLTAHRVVGEIKPTLGRNFLTRDLTADESRRIQTFVKSSEVLTQLPDSCISGVDGVIFLIEATGPEGYRFINRWGIDDGPVYDLANLMYRLTGWPNGDQGPDRHANNLKPI